MSKIALTPDVDGTGTLSIVSPNTNTNRTLTLPDESGSVLTSVSTLASANLSGALPAIDGSAVTSLTSANLTGALPAIDGSALTGVGASTTWDAVGTYAFLHLGAGSITESTTYAGSDLTPAGIGAGGASIVAADTDGAGNLTRGATVVSGTWRAMGRVNYSSGSVRSRLTLFVRTV